MSSGAPVSRHSAISALLQRGITAILRPIMKSHYIAVQARGTIALPADLRRRMHLDEPGAQVQIIEHQDGHIELQPVLPIPADQAWFWTERWQAMEREADEDIAAGRVSHAMDVDEFIANLERAQQE